MAEEQENLTLPIMSYGVGMPYLAIFNMDGYPIIEPSSGLPIGVGVTRFTFRSQVDKPNETEIIIETGSPLIADSPQLQTGMLLVIQWGYIFPHGNTLSSKPKPIRIKDVDYLFDNNGTKVTLKCEDQSNIIQYLPQYIPDPSNDYKFTDFMDDGFGEGVGIVIKRFYTDE